MHRPRCTPAATMHSIGGALGAYLGGYFFDTSASYGLVWMSSLWLLVVAAILVLAMSNKSRLQTSAA